MNCNTIKLVLTAKRTTMNCYMTGLPVYGERAKSYNVALNDIITYSVNDKMIYSVVVGMTKSSIKVIDLDCEILDDCIRFHLKDDQNRTTKNTLVNSRKIFKVDNIRYS